MAEKGWLGADLIFDLDGDHLPGVSDNDFPAMIDVIQGKPGGYGTNFWNRNSDSSKNTHNSHFPGIAVFISI